MNLIGAVLVSLWAMGWMIAAVRAGLKARVAAIPGDSNVTKARPLRITGGTTS
jgi:hypothetical protein